MTNASPVRWSRFRILPEIAAPLPMSRAEMEARGWEQCDVILVTGDAYVDHPAFGAAMVGRFLEWLGCRVGVIAQPRPDRVEDFAALGVPKLFWGVTAGNVDSQLARLTVMRKRRRDDPYTPGGLAGRRPPNATIVYTARVRQVGHGVPVVIGGIEASLRRLAYYDYWSDRVRRSLLVDAKADVLVYGMGEPPLADLVAQAVQGAPLGGVPGTARVLKTLAGDTVVRLPSYEAVSAPTEEGREAFSEMTRQIYRYSHPWSAVRLAQAHGDRWVVVEPPPLPLTTEEMDLIYALPFTNRPHPSYGQARIPAWEMIRDSITTHRGCYGECRFCAIAVHQGRTISSRSEGSIVAQARRMARDPSFRGTITDLGGPTANMWQTGCREKRGGCRGRRRCLMPEPCPRLQADFDRQRRLWQRVRSVPGVRHVFVASGIRHDLAMAYADDRWFEDLVRWHVSGRLKTAPEHVVERVLEVMGKPPHRVYRAFLKRFFAAGQRVGRSWGLTEYYLSGHPGCTQEDMIVLALHLRRRGVRPEQVQDFYPAPMTLASAMYYTGRDPLTGMPVAVARTDREKAWQRALLLCHLPEYQAKAREALRAAGREDLIGHGPEALVPP
jgi:uncharacterized radical SAM protein YgiQ